MPFSEQHKLHRRTVSINDSFHCSRSQNDNRNIKVDIPQEPANVHCFSPKPSCHFLPGLSSTWNGKPPKVPQLEQTQEIFSIMEASLREIIEMVKNDHASLKFSVDASSVSSHQMKTAERYIKELEFHLSKIEELREKYEVQQKMREGIRSMACAYFLSHGKRRDSALHNVHSGYKECNELLCSYEAKLQSMMGTFLLEMMGIQGFARVCKGDVFEIIIKHGDQKWKTCGHVLKNGKQSWGNRKVLFKAFCTDPLYIKAVEVRGLGKNILLGSKYCETKDLICAHRQQMVVNLNASGSLKLTLIITWNPVHGFSEKMNTLPTRPPLFGSQSLLNCESEISSSAESAIVSGAILEPKIRKSSSFQNSQMWLSGQSANSSDCSSSIEIASSNEFSCQISYRLQEMLHGFRISLESVHEQYPDLELLFNRVQEIDSLLKFQQQSVLGSDVSISVKNALGCFDFLNSAVADDLDCKFERDTDDSSEENSPEKAFQTYNPNNGENSMNSVVSSPLSLTSGEEQLDLAISTHSEYCLKLTEKLCSCSPLKFLEISALEKLKKQAFCFTTFLRIIRQIRKSTKRVSCDEFLSELDASIRMLWLKVVGTDSLTTTAEKFLLSIEIYFSQSAVSAENNNINSKVARRIVSKMLDNSSFALDAVITVAQFCLLFAEYDSVESLIQRFVSEVNILEELKSKKLSRIKPALLALKSMLPFSDALHEISYLLLDENSNLQTLAIHFLKEIGESPLKIQVTAAYIEGLENENNKIRQGSCAALHLLEAYDTFDQLVYLSNTDSCSKVQQEAKDAVLSFGVTEMKLQ